MNRENNQIRKHINQILNNAHVMKTICNKKERMCKIKINVLRAVFNNYHNHAIKKF